jgi:peptide/nickel transport system permease protein
VISQGLEEGEKQTAKRATEEPVADDLGENRGYYRLAFARLRRHRLAVISFYILVLIGVASVAGPLLMPSSMDSPNLYERFQGPGFPHLMGTDELGRDILFRILAGGRISIAVGLLATVVTICAGVSIGVLSGYFGGWVDMILMRFTDAVLSIPSIFVLILIATGFGTRPSVLVIAIGLTLWPDSARIIRSVVLSVREKDFVEAARSVGSGHARIIARHILPNSLGPIVVAATLSIGSAILAESTLSYLGLGIGPPISSWGSTLFRAQEFIWQAPYYALFPGSMILLTVLCINFIGDGLRDAFDPRSFER